MIFLKLAPVCLLVALLLGAGTLPAFSQNKDDTKDASRPPSPVTEKKADPKKERGAKQTTRQKDKNAAQQETSAPPAADPGETYKLKFKNDDLPEIVKDDPLIIEHFGYCDVVRVNGRVIELDGCRANGKIPVRVRGFETVWVRPNEETGTIESRLQVRSFDVPYPLDWGKPETNLKIEAGNLSEVLRTRHTVEQDMAGCKTNLTVKIEDIVYNKIHEFPEPPCHVYTIEVSPQLLSGTTPTITSGCLLQPGEQAFDKGRVKCWANRTDNQDPKLTFAWAPGYAPFKLDIPREGTKEGLEGDIATGRVVLQDRLLLQNLRPLWPYEAATPFKVEAGMPAYAAESVSYEDGCGEPLAIQGQQLPTLAEAQCLTVARRANIVIKSTGPNPETPLAALAFKDSYTDSYDIATIATAERTAPTDEIGKIAAAKRAVPTDEIKIPLPVRFSDEQIAEYDQKYGRGVSNSLPGIRIFTGEGCRTSGGALMRFKESRSGAKDNSATTKWPVTAWVMDPSDGKPATKCAKGEIEQDGAGAPFLTFKLESAKAIGKRRVVVVAMSDSFESVAKQPTLDALRDLIDAAHKAEEVRKPLSPITIYSVDGQGEYHLLFTGEDAALRPGEAKSLLLDRIRIRAVSTPPLDTIHNLSQLEAGFDYLLFLMDGKLIQDSDINVMYRYYSDLAVADDPQKITMLLASDTCEKWQVVGVFTCEDLGGLSTQPQRRTRLATALKALLLEPVALGTGDPIDAPAEATPTPTQGKTKAKTGEKSPKVPTKKAEDKKTKDNATKSVTQKNTTITPQPTEDVPPLVLDPLEPSSKDLKTP